MERARLGFIGIGIMGRQMVLRLLERGWRVTAWNLEPEALGTVTPSGAIAAASPKEVADASDIVLACVLNTDAVRDIVFGANGVTASDTRGKLLVDFSTIDPASSREMADQLQRERGMAWVDAPVSGGPLSARAGTLTVMAGGGAADVERARPIVADLAANFTHMGPSGAGQTTKVLNQAIVGTGYVLMAEALILAEKAGIDAALLPQCLAGGHADSSLLRRLYPQMQRREFEPPLAYARQLLKDMKFVKEFAHRLGLDLPVVEAAVARYGAYVEAGNEMADAASVIRAYEEKA